MKRLFLVVAACLALAVAGCGGETDPVKETIDRIEGAAEDRDADAVMKNVAASFTSAAGGSREEAAMTLRRYLKMYQQLEIRISDLQINRDTNLATARFHADLIGAPTKLGGLDSILPRSSSYDFKIELAPEGKQWKVTWASWSESSGATAR